jgi:PAS domain S-box-containing protein
LQRLNETLESQVAERTRERDRVWNNSSELMAVAGFDGYLKSVNPAWARVLGHDDATLLARPFKELIHPDDLPAALKVVASLKIGNPLLRFEDRMRRADGGYSLVSWTAVPEGDVFYAIGRDVTEQRGTEEALRQAQKMEAIGQLTGGIAHDFNNLLTGIIGSLDILRRRIAAGRRDDVDRFIDAAVTSANRAAGLTHRLLAFSRRQSLDLKPIDVNRLVTSIGDLLRRTLGEQMEFHTDLHGELWTAEVDPNQLETALLNLAINARDAMPDGGRLTITTRNTRIEDSYARRHEELAPGEYIAIAVTDNGAGMTQDVIDRAFDPFFTTKPIGQGTGLGLSMVYGFAKQSRGHVRIRSEVGEGTTVTLYLSRSRGDAVEDAAADAVESAARALAGETVLVVEDDAAVRLLVTEVLSELGYQALEAIDGKSAVPILQSKQRIDLLVTDVGLPGLNGRQVAEIARQSRPDLKVLFITGYAENAAIRGDFLAPGMELINKPFALDALAAKMREMLTG